MNKWKLITYYTIDTIYDTVCKEYFYKSISRLDQSLNFEIYQVENYHNWYLNTAQKAKVIRDALINLDSRYDSIVCVDADATIEQYPKLFDTIPKEYDIAYHLLSWKEWYGYEMDKKELLSGTMFFRKNDKVIGLCQEWYDENLKSKEWEQKILANILEKRKDINAYLLPFSYCQIKNRPNNEESLVKSEPVILHHQISRLIQKGKI